MNTLNRFVQTVTDSNGDGNPDFIETTIYDDSGKVSSKTFDSNADGSANTLTTYTYDANDILTDLFVDSLYRGRRNRTRFWLDDYRADEAGNATFTYTELEDGSDAIYIFTYSFNADGDPLVIGGFFDNESYTYNEAGQLILFEDKSYSFYNPTGISTKRYTYNESGQRVSETTTFRGGGTRIEQYTYDNSGNLFTTETLSEGERSLTTNFYDAAGSLIEENTTTTIDDGTSQSTLEYAFGYTYDNAGNLTRKTFDAGSDGTFESVDTFAYDADGNLVYEAFDNSPGDGRPEQTVTRIYSDVLPEPVAVDDEILTENDVLLLGNVFADNGNGRDRDAKGAAFLVSEIDGVAAVGSEIVLASGALLRVSAGGSFVYDPNGQFETLLPGEQATDSFTYTLTDFVGSTDSATVAITIEGASTPSLPSTVLRQQSVDSDSDGVPESTTIYTFDEASNLVREVETSSVGALPMGGLITLYTYDPVNNLAKRTVDRNSDGIPDSIYTTEYDLTGNIVQETSDEDGDGILDSTITTTYDAAGNRTSTAYDNDGDGIFDNVTRYSYVAGRLISETYDYNLDGIPEGSYTYNYDATGNKTSESYDSDGDGVPDSIYTYTYNEAGNLTLYARDWNGDGVSDLVYAYTYDSAGNQTSETVNGSGFVGSSTASTYDDEGNLVSFSEFFSTFFGTRVSTTTYSYVSPDTLTASEYDEMGNLLISSAADEGAGGTTDNLLTYPYSNAALLTETAQDYGADRDVDLREIDAYAPDSTATIQQGDATAPLDGFAIALGSSADASSLGGRLELEIDSVFLNAVETGSLF